MARRFRYKDIQLPQLRSFCAAATQNNFTSAARSLGLSPPTVWEQVRGLERRLGATLLNRKGRSVELTPEGKLLLGIIQPHINGLDSLEKLFEAQRAELPQRLVVSSTPNMLSYHLVAPVRRFMEKYPSVCLNLKPNVRVEEAARVVERNEADLGVVPYFPALQNIAALEYEPLFDMDLMLLTAVDHPLAKLKKVTPQDLVQYPLIMGLDGTHSRAALERILRRNNLLEQVQLVMETSHAEVIRNYVSAGIGVAVLFVAPELGKQSVPLHQRVFDAKVESLPVGIVYRRGAHLTQVVEEFRDILRKLLGKARKPRA
ncbi:MAG: LysR family transcriptional regulator [Gemmataceae bacterium]